VKRYLAEEKLEDTRLVEVDQRVYARMAYRDKVEGLLAVAPIPRRNIEAFDVSETPFLLVALGIEKPGNLGALLRTADGAGVDALLLCGGGVDLYNPNVIRASLGAVFTVPAFEMSLESALTWLGKRKIQIILTSPDASTDYTNLDYTGPVAIVLGSEKQGLPEILLRQDITQVKIPMYGQMDSLNVSCSGAILLYEVLRQRKCQN
jgi:TrmH family RNA methyltransferase